MKKVTAVFLLAALLLSGCTSWMDGSYVSTTPHLEQNNTNENQIISVSSYEGLCGALVNMVENGTESAVLSVEEYEHTWVNSDVQQAVSYVKENNPIAAYAVDKIQYELGTSAGKMAVGIEITYLHDQREIRKIEHVKDTEAARQVIQNHLDNCHAVTVLYLEKYEQVDFLQIVEDYAIACPQRVMETPAVSVNVYPETGDSRVVELKYTYQNSREALRNMKNQVSPVFASAVLYVSGDAAEKEKFSQLYSFLMERYDYQHGTSITPTYSLLRHGVGDAKAFAVVYAAMCREAGLNCETITGTRNGQPWVWNAVKDAEELRYVDLLRCSQEGRFREKTQKEMMHDYVWDYSDDPFGGTKEDKVD